MLFIECDGVEQRLFASQTEACSVTGISSWHVSRACNVNADSLDPVKGVLDWEGRRYYSCYVSLGDCASAGQPLAAGADAAGARRSARAPDEAFETTAGKECMETQAGGALVGSKPLPSSPQPPPQLPPLSCLASPCAPVASASTITLDQQTSSHVDLSGSSGLRLGGTLQQVQRWAMGLLQRHVHVCGVNSVCGGGWGCSCACM